MRIIGVVLAAIFGVVTFSAPLIKNRKGMSGRMARP
jgi:hypothetical protein